MKAAHIMRHPVLATTPSTPVRDVLAKLVINHISGMPVVEHDGTVIGVVTEDDILRAVVEGRALGTLTVWGVMSRAPITVDVETALIEVMQTIYSEGILRVPVVERGRLVGIISRSDVIMALAQPEYWGDPAFPVFDRQPRDTPEKSTPPPEQPVHTHG
jgi:CBS domain-containing protein